MEKSTTNLPGGESRSTPLRHGLFVVIAGYNEEEIIGQVVREGLAYAETVVLVDDGSSDQTAWEANQAGATVLQHFLNRGQGAALQTGIEYSLQKGAQIIVTFDADGQHDPTNIPAMIEPVRSGQADVTLGSRFLGETVNLPWTRFLVLKWALLFTRLTSGLKLTDTHNGFRALSRKAASIINIRIDRMAHASEIIDQIAIHRLRYIEVPVRVRYTEYSRRKGQSGLRALNIFMDYLFGRLTK